MSRERYYKQSLGPSLQGRLKKARVLMIGAGGIGCELLKNLVLSGFGEIHIVDLDTIDLSNLNRQFLFRHEHIKRSKALVAKESASSFNPNVTIEAHHANIKDPQFNIDWYQKFDMVFNALDNLEARRHVNKMCLAADRPLIESGTTGFNGQVQVIKRNHTRCYDCTPKETPKSFPVCTIRSTPSQPIHCIVWAKSYLFAEIFGTSEDDAPDMDNTEDSENAGEIEALRTEAHALKRIRESMGSQDFPRKVFEKVFKDDIERLCSMEDMWKSRRKPQPLDFDSLTEEALGVGEAMGQQDQKTWTPAENFAVFSTSLRKLSDRLEEIRSNADAGNATPVLSFDKDDKDTLDFVAASANLRSLVFGIESKSEFQIKEMAGNIIPAIATTNAMTAGLCVMQALKVMREAWDKARMVFLTRSTDRVINTEPLGTPNPKCAVCGVMQARVDVDLSRATLDDLVSHLLRTQLAYQDDFSVVSEAGTMFDADLEDNLPNKLCNMGIQGDSFITVVDEADEDPRVNLVLAITHKALPSEDRPISLPEKFEIARKPKTQTHEAPSNGVNGAANGHGSKRKRSVEEAGLEGELAAKRGKVLEGMPNGAAAAAQQEPIVIDDDGAIMID